MLERILGAYHHRYRDRLLRVTDSIIELFTSENTLEMSDEYKRYITSEYPQNHTFKIVNNKIQPRYKLATRYKKLLQLYPDILTSFLDIGCSKGFFVFSANDFQQCTRSMGIDVNQYALNICRWLKQNLQIPTVHFEKMRLHELAERIEEFGGQFQTVLLVNAYQYLYFGSDNYRDAYHDHDFIFKNLRKICSHRIVFNNRVELQDCQNVNCIDYNDIPAQNYSEERMLEAAAKYFTITRHGRIGKCPLITFDAK